VDALAAAGEGSALGCVIETDYEAHMPHSLRHFKVDVTLETFLHFSAYSIAASFR
jgi:hypothetical protein